MTLFLVLLVFIGASALLAWFLISHDHGEKEPISALWIAVGFGFAGAVAASFIEGWLLSSDKLQPPAPQTSILLGAMIIGAIEEACKFVPLAVYIYKKRYFNEHTDGVIYFALAGLGFGLPENILYTLQFGSGTGMWRLLLTPMFHAATMAMVGYFLASNKLAGKPLYAIWPILGIAMILHGLYDFGLLSNSNLFALMSLIITFGLSAGLFVLFLKANQQDQAAGLSVVGHNAYCRSCGYPNPDRSLYCEHCGKNA